MIQVKWSHQGGPWSNTTGVLTLRGGEDTETDTHWGKTTCRNVGRRRHLQVKERGLETQAEDSAFPGTTSANTWNWDLQPPDLWGSETVLFEPPDLWNFAAAALTHLFKAGVADHCAGLSHLKTGWPFLACKAAGGVRMSQDNAGKVLTHCACWLFLLDTRRAVFAGYRQNSRSKVSQPSTSPDSFPFWVPCLPMLVGWLSFFQGQNYRLK